MPNRIAPFDSGLTGRFMGATARDLADYLAQMRGRTDTLSINAAEGFVRAWNRRHLHRPDAPFHGAGAEVIAAMGGAAQANGLALVSAALLAIEAADWDAAARLAERAYAMDQHETFAQRLFLAAREESASLHLAVDDWLQDRFCPNPFTDAEVIGNGDVYTCCAAWLPARIGSARAADWPDYWNGPRAAELRRSVRDGDFGHCSRLSCPRIASRSLPLRAEVTDPALRALIDTPAAPAPPPRRVLMSYDTSCNLSCPSCRTHLITKSQAEARDLDAFYDARIAPMLKAATHIKITGSGDPFGSRHFRKVIDKLTVAPPTDGPRLQLHTNGVLLDERAWRDLRLEGQVRSVWISVDATEAETYAVLRRDGDFDRLQRNLAFLGGLRRAGRLAELRLDFVVQAANFRQMPALVDQAERIGADGVHFLMLRNWGTYSQAEFLDLAVAVETHPQHAELLDLLRDARFGRPGVDLGNLSPLRPAQPCDHRPPQAPALHKAVAPLVLVLSQQRTGSNLLFDRLTAFPELMVLREVLNPRGAFGLRKTTLRRFGQLLQHDLLDETDDRLLRHIRRHPMDSLLQIRRDAAELGRKAAVIKLFPDHIDPDLLTRQLLPDPEVLPLIATRDLISTYISHQKARATEVWTHADTSGQKITADLGDFTAWMAGTAQWWQTISAALHQNGRRIVHLRHDTDLAPPEAESLDRIAAALHALGLDLGPPGPVSVRRQRQDRTPDPFDRLLNGANFRAELAEARLLTAALAHPPV